jgi:hypothetical protein
MCFFLLILQAVLTKLEPLASFFIYIKYLFSGYGFDLTAHIFRMVATKEYGRERYSTGRLITSYC